VLIGLFAFGQLLSDVKDRVQARKPLMSGSAAAVKVEHLEAIKIIFRSWINLLRSSFIGVFVGVLPAAGGSISNILAYDQAKKASRTPEKFGTGVADGIIAPESANNATAGGALMILMALGIPGDLVAAVMLGALLIHDVAPSPTFITENAVLAYGIFIAFFIAHPIMIMLQAVCLRGFLLVTRVPMYTLAAVILAYCAIGVFALENSTHDLWTVLIFGVLGYAMRVLRFPIAPMILGVVLGNMAELNLSRAYATASDMTMFVTSFALRPWSAFFLLLGVFSIGFPWYQQAYGRKKWTLAYIPLMAIALALPMFFMHGTVRPIVAAALLLWAAFALWKRHTGGWALEVGDKQLAGMKE
jgi:putative tricarboxylic transport membrane protein